MLSSGLSSGRIELPEREAMEKPSDQEAEQRLLHNMRADLEIGLSLWLINAGSSIEKTMAQVFGVRTVSEEDALYGSDQVKSL